MTLQDLNKRPAVKQLIVFISVFISISIIYIKMFSSHTYSFGLIFIGSVVAYGCGWITENLLNVLFEYGFKTKLIPFTRFILQFLMSLVVPIILALIIINQLLPYY